MYSKIKEQCQKVNYILIFLNVSSWHNYLEKKYFFQTEVVLNRFINLYQPANCFIQSMESLMENEDQSIPQMYSDLINGLNDGLIGKETCLINI